MKRFFKCSFVFIITFVLVFSITVPCFASDTNTHGGGGGQYVNMSDEEKLEWWRFRAKYYIARLIGFDEDTANNFAVDHLLPCWDVKGYSTLEEYFLAHVNYNEETDSLDPDEEMIADINMCLEQYNDSVTMVYRYPLNKANIDASKFPNKNFLNAFTALLDAFPDCYFYASDDLTGNYDACDLDTGTTSAQVWKNHYIFWVVEKPVSGVNAYPDLMTTPVSLYDDNWNRCKAACVAICSSDNYETADNITYFSVSNIYYYNAYRRYDGNMYSSLSDLKFTYFSSSGDLSMCNQFSWKRTLTDLKTPYSASKNPINVYKTVADMKKDIGSQVIGGYTSDYTGSCAPSVSVDVVNNVEIPDSGGGSGSGSGSGSGTGSGDSGGGVFDGIISGIADAVGSIIKGLFSIVKDFVEAVADVIVSITKSITDLTGLLSGNFTDFLTAVFPFMPKEFITVMIAGMTLMLLGIVVKIFRG